MVKIIQGLISVRRSEQHELLLKRAKPSVINSVQGMELPYVICDLLYNL